MSGPESVTEDLEACLLWKDIQKKSKNVRGKSKFKNRLWFNAYLRDLKLNCLTAWNKYHNSINIHEALHSYNLAQGTYKSALINVKRQFILDEMILVLNKHSTLNSFFKTFKKKLSSSNDIEPISLLNCYKELYKANNSPVGLGEEFNEASGSDTEDDNLDIYDPIIKPFDEVDLDMALDRATSYTACYDGYSPKHLKIANLS